MKEPTSSAALPLETSEQEPQFVFSEHYVTVREAAHMLGVSERTIYTYLERGKLASERVGPTIVLRKEQVRSYRRTIVGRPRINTPRWRLPVTGNLPYLLHIAVRVREGQSEQLEPRLMQIRQAQSHALPGTVARYIIRCTDPEIIQVVLLWRRLTMPSEQERLAALKALQADLADLLDWGTARSLEGVALLNT